LLSETDDRSKSRATGPDDKRIVRVVDDGVSSRDLALCGTTGWMVSGENASNRGPLRARRLEVSNPTRLQELTKLIKVCRIEHNSAGTMPTENNAAI
jgi:hypothetical protein